MRYQFTVFLGITLTLGAAYALGGVSSAEQASAWAGATATPVNLINLSNPSNIYAPLDDSDLGPMTMPIALRTRPATAEVMNLPAQPIPTPPAFEMGITVLLGLAGYKLIRRLRAA